MPLSVQHAISANDQVLCEPDEELRGKNYVLKPKQQQHARSVLDRVPHDVAQHAQIHQQQCSHERRQSHVREPTQRRRRLRVLHPVLVQPVKRLHEQQAHEQRDEPRVKLLSKYCHRQTRLHHCISRAFVQPLDLRLPKRSQKRRLDDVRQHQHQRERKVSDGHQRRFARAQVHHRRKVLFPRVQRVRDDARHRTGAQRDVFRKREHGWIVVDVASSRRSVGVVARSARRKRRATRVIFARARVRQSRARTRGVDCGESALDLIVGRTRTRERVSGLQTKST